MLSRKADNNIIGRHPISSFIVITLIVSYFFGVPFQMFMSALLPGSNEVMSYLVPRTVTVYGPAIAALIVAGASNGSHGVKTLLQKLVPRSEHLLWIMLIPIFLSFITFGSFAIGGMTLSDLLQFIVNDGHLLILQWVGQFIIVGVGEELGWRGWLLPRLAQKYTMGISVLLIIVIWGAWHLPVFMSPLQFVIPWCLILISLSVITTFIWYKVKGNVFVLAVFHASFNALVVFLENRLREMNADEFFVTGWMVLGYTYVALGLILLMRTHRLWKSRSVVFAQMMS